jgi:hypothetical protein
LKGKKQTNNHEGHEGTRRKKDEGQRKKEEQKSKDG